MHNLPQIHPEKVVNKIASFIKATLLKQKIEQVVIGISGGIDSSVSLYLARKAISEENIYVMHMPYFNDQSDGVNELLENAKIPQANRHVISIKSMVDVMRKELKIEESSTSDQIRMGNIMARVRMIVLFDFAKKHNALVLGTENRSEYHLGYFTRFGDEASDIEPLQHLYKTHVYEIAKHLEIPQSIIEKAPSANLWQDQTDEKEFGFSYKEADPVLYLYFDKKKSIEEIEKEGLTNAKRIIEFAKNNSYKHNTPYSIRGS